MEVVTMTTQRTRLTKREMHALIDAANIALAGGMDDSMYESEQEYDRVSDALSSAREKLIERL